MKLSPDATRVTLSPTAKKLARRYPHSSAMRAAAHLYTLRQRIAKVVTAKKPQTGPFYWVPKPNPQVKGINWTVVPFYDEDYGGYIGHDQAWNEVLELLSIWWKRDPRAVKSQLNSAYTAVPRGRVIKNLNGYEIAHGGDHLKPDDVPGIIRAYALPKGSKPVLDEHERMLTGDPELFQEVLGINTGLSGVNPYDSELEDEWEEVA